MTLGQEKFQFPLKLILFQWKTPIVTFLTLVVLAAYGMTKFHPQKILFGKEYNYMYSLENSMRGGTLVPIEKVEGKLLSFENVRPLFDDLFIQAHLEESHVDKVDNILKDIYRRLPLEDDVIKNFTQGSLKIEQNQLQDAYLTSLALLQQEKLDVDYPTLYIYHLYRVHLLEEALGYDEKATLTKERLLSYVTQMKETKFGKSRTLRTIHAKLTK